MAKRIVLMFGQMGSGKSFRGRMLAGRLGLRFVEGDEMLSPRMLERASQFKPVRPDDLADSVLRLGLGVAMAAHEAALGVVVAQALYRDVDRRWLIRLWENQGFEVHPVWVRVPFLTNARQLLTRERGWRWVLYWLTNKPWWQRPTHPTVSEGSLL